METGSTKIVKERGTGIPQRIAERKYLLDFTEWIVETFEVEKLQGIDLEGIIEEYQKGNL